MSRRYARRSAIGQRQPAPEQRGCGWNGPWPAPTPGRVQTGRRSPSARGRKPASAREGASRFVLVCRHQVFPHAQHVPDHDPGVQIGHSSARARPSPVCACRAERHRVKMVSRVVASSNWLQGRPRRSTSQPCASSAACKSPWPGAVSGRGWAAMTPATCPGLPCGIQVADGGVDEPDLQHSGRRRNRPDRWGRP